MARAPKEPQDAAVTDVAETIVACAAEGDRRGAVLAAAIVEAEHRHARLVLYDIDTTSSWVDPLPESEAERFQHPLSPHELRELGRSSLAAQVDKARARGVHAFGWLPRHHGADAMIDYACDLGATTVMVSADLETPTFLQRLHHLTAARARERAEGNVTLLLIPG